MRPVRSADNLPPSCVPLSRNLGALTSWNPLCLSKPVKGLLYLYLYLFTIIYSTLLKDLVTYDAVHLLYKGRFDITCSLNFFSPLLLAMAVGHVSETSVTIYRSTYCYFALELNQGLYCGPQNHFYS